jgi:hypothetical protein
MGRACLILFLAEYLGGKDLQFSAMLPSIRI